MAIKDPLKNLSPEQIRAIVEKHQEEAESRKTETIQFRVTPRVKAEIKKAAQANGYSKYQQWINVVLYDAVAKTFPENYHDSGDDF